MTKLSFVFDQEIRCWILGSSSILLRIVSHGLCLKRGVKNCCRRWVDVLIELVDESRLHDLRLLSCGGSSDSGGNSMVAHIWQVQ